MGYDTIWHWRFAQYDDDALRAWIRRVPPGDESAVDLIAIEELAKRVAHRAGFEPAASDSSTRA